MNKGKYYITTAIAYTSGVPHIGNSYEIVLADSIARFKRKDGYDVFFQTGTDEHGQKIELKAQEAGVTPKAFVDNVAGEIRRICDALNTSYDKFIRTTDDYHEKQVQKIFKKLYNQGDIYKGYYEGMYCTPCESFWTESQLVDGKCPDCGREVKPAKEEAYFLLPGLQDLCVSRTSYKWGIPVDFDDKHVIYVWMDALSNYITGIGYDADGESGEQYGKFWPADLHLIGKDIIRFHTIYWPIFLMAMGEPLPRQVFGHPWLLQGDGKMSKSKGNVIYADDLIDFFGVDAVRYFVLHEMPFENDGVITWDLMVERMNSDLANTLGNLVNRTISMSNKYFGGKVENKKVGVDAGAEDVDADLARVLTDTYNKVSRKMDELRVADAITEIFTLFKRSNKYIDETMPWALAKDETKRDRLATVLYNLSNAILVGASLLEPYMPETAKRISEQMNAPLADFAVLETCASKQDTATASTLYPSGTQVTQTPEILFARQDLAEVMERVEAMFAQRKSEACEEEKSGMDEKFVELAPKDEITYDDFDKCQFQVGLVLACEEVPKSKKLLKFKIQVGGGTRQILSGIKQYYKPEELVGKRVMVLVNLKPREIAGQMSEGMILSAADEEGNLAVMTPERFMPAGSEIC